MYVRWLGAFRRNGSLYESFNFEMTRKTNVACEHFKVKSLVSRARVGLLVDPKAVYKNWNGDVWSEYDADGCLYYTRKDYEADSAHKESWAKPVYTGIVIKGGDLVSLSKKAQEQIIKAAKDFNLPLYKLSDGKLKKMTI